VEALAWPDEAVNVTMDVSAYVDTKRTALLCHATQFGAENVFRRVIEADPGQLLGVEHYALVWPQPQPGWSTNDLLAGLSQT
jgi:LmbE family N-acetylglucosaminyl deacetylase